MTNVENPKRRNRWLRGSVEEHLHHSVHDIIDVREIATVLTLVEQLDRCAFADRLGKQDWRHVRPAPWPVNGEEPKARDHQSVQMRITVRHQLVALLRRAI